MCEPIIFKTAKMETGQLIIDIPLDQRGAVMKFLRTKKDRAYDLIIKEHRKKRSLDANAYAWTLINRLADVLRISPVEVYQQAIINIGGNYEIIPIKEEAAAKFKEVWQKQGLGWPVFDMGASKLQGYRNLRAYYGSSTYDTRQMSQLIDNIVQDCKALGIETKPDEEIASLLGEWK